MRFNLLLPLAAASLALAAPEPIAAPADSSGLLTELPIILSGAQNLLSTDNVNNLDIIIGGAAKLLSPANIGVLQDILTNAHTLLTKDFVDNTTTLITDATPVCISFHVTIDDDGWTDALVAGRGGVEVAGRGIGTDGLGNDGRFMICFLLFDDSIRVQLKQYTQLHDIES